jgi:hypothetical protein
MAIARVMKFRLPKLWWVGFFGFSELRGFEKIHIEFYLSVEMKMIVFAGEN